MGGFERAPDRIEIVGDRLAPPAFEVAQRAQADLGLIGELLLRPAQPSARRVLDDMRAKLLDIEVPLNDAIDHVQALRLIGEGLIAEYHDAGSPIFATAGVAEERLDALKEIWVSTREIGRRSAREIVAKAQVLSDYPRLGRPIAGPDRSAGP